MPRGRRIRSGPDLGFFLLKSYLFKSVLFSNLFFKICVSIHHVILFILSMLGRACPGSFPRQCHAPMQRRRNFSCRRSCQHFRTQIKSCMDGVSLSVSLHRSYSALCPQHRPSVARCLVLPECLRALPRLARGHSDDRCYNSESMVLGPYSLR